jgi:hypothetical protein
MKSSIYFLSVVISTFLGSMFLMEKQKITSETENTSEVEFFHTEREEDYLKCEKMIDSVEKNNEITKENFKFVENQLSQLN